LLVIVRLIFSSAALAHGGGGFGGGSGGFGGGGGGGFGGGGGGFGGGGGGGQQEQAEEPVEGDWALEFRLEFDSAVEGGSRDRQRVRADVKVIGQEVTGQLRGDGTGQFRCTMLDGSDRCENGELRITWKGAESQEIATFEFEIDRIDGGRTANGEASVTAGVVRQYKISMRKR